MSEQENNLGETIAKLYEEYKGLNSPWGVDRSLEAPKMKGVYDKVMALQKKVAGTPFEGEWKALKDKINSDHYGDYLGYLEGLSDAIKEANRFLSSVKGLEFVTQRFLETTEGTPEGMEKIIPDMLKQLKRFENLSRFVKAEASKVEIYPCAYRTFLNAQSLLAKLDREVFTPFQTYYAEYQRQIGEVAAFEQRYGDLRKRLFDTHYVVDQLQTVQAKKAIYDELCMFSYVELMGSNLGRSQFTEVQQRFAAVQDKVAKLMGEYFDEDFWLDYQFAVLKDQVRQGAETALQSADDTAAKLYQLIKKSPEMTAEAKEKAIKKLAELQQKAGHIESVIASKAGNTISFVTGKAEQARRIVERFRKGMQGGGKGPKRKP